MFGKTFTQEQEFGPVGSKNYIRRNYDPWKNVFPCNGGESWTQKSVKTGSIFTLSTKNGNKTQAISLSNQPLSTYSNPLVVNVD